MDRLRIIKISFVANYIVFDKTRIQQDNFMTELGQFSGLVMGASARFYANNTGWIVGKKASNSWRLSFFLGVFHHPAK
jgi:hypothetical protein